jgi:hypothetical protein
MANPSLYAWTYAGFTMRNAFCGSGSSSARLLLRGKREIDGHTEFLPCDGYTAASPGRNWPGDLAENGLG